MAEVLRPMSTGELMDRTFALYKRNFKLFVGIATVGPATYLMFQLLTVGSAVVPAATTRRTGAFAGASLGIGMLAGVVIMLAGMAIAHAATVKAVAAVHLGLPITIGGAYKSLKGKLWRILGVFLCMILLAALAVVVASIAAVIVTDIFTELVPVGAHARGASAIATAVIGFSTMVILGVFIAVIWIRYALAIAACVVEDLGVFRSLRRSSALSKGSRFRVFIVYIVLVILAALVGAALDALAGAASMLTPNMVARLIVVYVASFVAGSLTSPLATIGIALVYYDERVRKEAFDLQFMMASLDAPAPAAAAVVPAQP